MRPAGSWPRHGARRWCSACRNISIPPTSRKPRTAGRPLRTSSPRVSRTPRNKLQRSARKPARSCGCLCVQSLTGGEEDIVLASKTEEGEWKEHGTAMLRSQFLSEFGPFK
jgi:hypothetical protein